MDSNLKTFKAKVLSLNKKNSNVVLHGLIEGHLTFLSYVLVVKSETINLIICHSPDYN
jgi:hypothetical protein